MKKIIVTIFIFLSLATVTQAAMNFPGSVMSYAKLKIPTSSNAIYKSTKGSVSVWVKSTSDTAQTWFELNDNNNNGEAVQFTIGNGVTGTITNEIICLDATQSASHRICYVPATRAEVIDGRWHHIVVTGDGQRFQLYLDSLPRLLTVGSGSNDGLWFQNASGLSSMLIGSTTGTGGNQNFPMKGAIDDLQVYNRVLTQSEVIGLYRGGQTPGGLMARWLLLGNSGTFEPDISIGNNDMEFTGTTTKVFLNGPPKGRYRR